jgi:hypothetical protein
MKRNTAEWIKHLRTSLAFHCELPPVNLLAHIYYLSNEIIKPRTNGDVAL